MATTNEELLRKEDQFLESENDILNQDSEDLAHQNLISSANETSKSKTEISSFQWALKHKVWQVRFTFVLLCLLENCICYADRTNISVAIIPMANEFKWTNSEQGAILSAFFWGYMMTQIPGGILSGYFGPKTILIIGVILWSLFTFLTPMCSYYFILLLICRFALGAGEGVNYPCLHMLSGSWFPLPERTSSVALMTSGQYLGIFVALIISPPVAISLGWPWIFYLFSIVGWIWAIIFQWKTASTPTKHKTISKEELEYIASSLSENDSLSGNSRITFCSIPWKEFTKTPAIYAIIVAHFANNYGFYIMISWMPQYFNSLGVKLENIGWFTLIPYLGMFIMSNTSGLISSLLMKKGVSVRNIRRIIQTVAFLTPSIFFALLSLTSDPNVALVFVTFAMCGIAWSHSGFWVNMVDISPKYGAYIMGLSNTIGSLAGSLGNLITGFVIDTTGSWILVFIIMVLILICSLIFYLIFVKGEVIFR